MRARRRELHRRDHRPLEQAALAQRGDDLLLAARQLDVEVDLDPVERRLEEGVERLVEGQRRARCSASCQSWATTSGVRSAAGRRGCPSRSQSTSSSIVSTPASTAARSSPACCPARSGRRPCGRRGAGCFARPLGASAQRIERRGPEAQVGRITIRTSTAATRSRLQPGDDRDPVAAGRRRSAAFEAGDAGLRLGAEIEDPDRGRDRPRPPGRAGPRAGPRRRSSRSARSRRPA